MFLVLMTAFNGLPVPAGVPSEPLHLVAFMFLMTFVYVLPFWLVTRERRYVREGNESSSFLGYAVATGSISLLWGLPLLISAFST
jgi:predicted cation transporter